MGRDAEKNNALFKNIKCMSVHIEKWPKPLIDR